MFHSSFACVQMQKRMEKHKKHELIQFAKHETFISRYADCLVYSFDFGSIAYVPTVIKDDRG